MRDFEAFKEAEVTSLVVSFLDVERFPARLTFDDEVPLVVFAGVPWRCLRALAPLLLP